MKILFLTIGSEKTPSTRFRVKQYFPLLEQAHVEFRHVPIPHATLKRISLLKHLSWSDIVFLQKKLFSVWELGLIKRFQRPLIFDMDDVIFQEHPVDAGTARSERKITRKKNRFKATLEAADIIITGNESLAADVERYGHQAIILPTPVDTDRFIPRQTASQQQHIVIGWIGTTRNLYYLDLIAQPLQNLCHRFPHIAVRLVSDGTKTLPGVRVENKAWTAQDEVSELQQFDIGVMPLTDDIYSRGKCGFKLLQYMSIGLPTVSSPVGVNRDIIDHSVDGFLANTALEWEDCLAHLIQKAELRRNMAREARKKVVAHYSVKALFPRFLDILQKTYRQDT
ncbi:glycosyltransferase family 4 protein [candidate division CSSED10-310 bacterium]|uniref:Glycosyltransferase family 4 protein n=1 Tax=candidate division CSSED10-310 bacterium TaxID=2855610 RepID=A0ABV6Z5Y5_UNCC1